MARIRHQQDDDNNDEIEGDTTWPELDESFRNRRQRARDRKALLNPSIAAVAAADSDSSGAAGLDDDDDDDDDDNGANARRHAANLINKDDDINQLSPTKEIYEDIEPTQDNDILDDDDDDMFADVPLDEGLESGTANGTNYNKRGITSKKDNNNKDNDDDDDDEVDEDAGYDEHGAGLRREYDNDRRKKRQRIRDLTKGSTTDSNNIGNIDGNTGNYDDDEDEEDAPIAVTAFNMREELETGRLNEDGVYVENRDEDEIHDAWLLDVQQTQSAYRKAQQEHERQLKRVEEQLQQLNSRPIAQLNANQCYVEVLKILRPGEDASNAFIRLAGAVPKTSKQKGKSKAKKNNKKKSKNDDNISKDQETRDFEDFNKLTELTDRLINEFDDLDIYYTRYESLVRKLRLNGFLPDTWNTGDPIPYSTL